MKRAKTVWSAAMVQRLHELIGNKVSSTVVARTLFAEFGVLLTRNAVLGRLHRDRLAGKPVPLGLGPGGVDREAVLKAIERKSKAFKKDNWRKDDEKWLDALDMLKAGHSLKRVAAIIRVPEEEARGKLRSIVADDIKHFDATAEDWAFINV